MDCTQPNGPQCWVLNIGEAGSTDPNIQTRSDAITAQLLSPTVLTIDMNSDPQPQFGDTTLFCAEAPGGVCTAFEDGSIQRAFSVLWSPLIATGTGNGTEYENVIDTINFQSDTEVPEPRFGAVFVSGLVG